jgi:FAD binding domain
LRSPEDNVAREATEALRADVAGEVFVPGDPGYDQSRQAWMLAADQRPAVVVEAASAADVIAAVLFARSHGLRIAPQGTGHGAVPLEPLDSALLLRTSRMRGVRIDPDAQTARADAGTLWQDVIGAASEHGLAALAGTSPNVGVTGYTLGGGLGWLARCHGLAANSVTAAEMVTPDGQLVRADADHDPDLFWAVRGGGGSVGVVTALEMRLYPVHEVYAGALYFPLRQAAEVLRSWREWTSSIPDEVTSLGRIMRFPPELIAPLRELGPEMGTFATMPVPALGQLHMDPTTPVPALGDGVLWPLQLHGQPGYCRRSAATGVLPAYPADQDELRSGRRDHLPAPGVTPGHGQCPATRNGAQRFVVLFPRSLRCVR